MRLSSQNHDTMSLPVQARPGPGAPGPGADGSSLSTSVTIMIIVHDTAAHLSFCTCNIPVDSSRRPQNLNSCGLLQTFGGTGRLNWISDDLKSHTDPDAADTPVVGSLRLTVTRQAPVMALRLRNQAPTSQLPFTVTNISC